MPDGYAIVLSAYDGAPWIEGQVESIRGQTARDWRLYARDDGSGDDTPERLRRLAREDSRIEVLARDGRNVGPAESFGALLQHALDRGERHVFLSDQDDVWLPDKCERLLAVMAACEARSGADTPILVHSDVCVVAEDLSTIHPSFARQQGFAAGGEPRTRRLLLGNSVTGCATLVNAALLRCALPMPAVAMHDWWLAQCAAAFGEVHYLDSPTVLYRQHEANTVGARNWLARAAGAARSPRSWWIGSARRFLQGLHQVWVIRSRARTRGLALAPVVRETIEQLSEGLAPDRGVVARLSAAVRSEALPRPIALRLLLLSRIAMLPFLRARLGDEWLAGKEPGCA